MESGAQSTSRKDAGNRNYQKSRSPYKRKVTSSYRVMSEHEDRRQSSRSSSRSSSSGSCSSSSTKRMQKTPSPAPRPIQPPKQANPNQPYKTTRAAAVKYSVARSKHMRRIKYALSPISGRKVYPLEPSKTNQPTYASSGQIGSRVTASGIKYTYLLEKVLQAQVNSVQQQNGTCVYSDINNHVLHQANLLPNAGTHITQPSNNTITAACNNVNMLSEQSPMVNSQHNSTNQSINGTVLRANQNQVFAANHNPVFAHFYPAMANQLSIQPHPSLSSSQHNGGGTFLHLTTPQNTTFIDQCRMEHDVVSSSSCCRPLARFNASFVPGMMTAQCCPNGFAAAVRCDPAQGVVTSAEDAISRHPRVRKRESVATSPAPVLAKIEEEE